MIVDNNMVNSFNSKGKFLFKMHFYQKFENTRILLGNCVLDFPKNLGISKIEKQHSLYNSRNHYEIFRFFFEKSKINLENSKIYLKILIFIYRPEFWYF